VAPGLGWLWFAIVLIVLAIIMIPLSIFLVLLVPLLLVGALIA
jgi:hypothetical protein